MSEERVVAGPNPCELCACRFCPAGCKDCQGKAKDKCDPKCTATMIDRIRSLESQLAQVTQERDEAQAREAAVIDRLKAEIAKCQWCGGKGTYTDTIGENTYPGKCIHCEPYQDMLATLQDPSHACDVWKAMKAELEARREVMTQMCFNEGYGDQAQFDAAWAKLEEALVAWKERAREDCLS